MASRKSIGISSLACCDMWVKMRALPWAIALPQVAAEVIATILPSHGQRLFSKMPNENAPP
ncbi:MAG: hypothetical protein WCK15_14525 [Pirellula sp.]